MEYGTVAGIDKPISRLVQGTMMIRSDVVEQSFQLLDDVFSMGCTTFDTAHVYGQGDCERTFGRWLAERGVREQVVILGKGAHHNADRRRVTPYDITSDLFDSLARLHTDYIDLYLLHRDDPATSVGPIVEVLNEHRAAGRIRAFGGSNWRWTRIVEANEYAYAHGLEPFAAGSPQFSLAIQFQEPWENCVSITGAEQEAERSYYAETRMPLFAWSSLAGGFFSGRFRRDNLAEMSSYFDRLCVDSYCHEENFRRLERVTHLAEVRGVTAPQIALAYVLCQPWDVFTLVGCANGAEFRMNLAALNLKLSTAELAWLEQGDETMSPQSTRPTSEN